MFSFNYFFNCKIFRFTFIFFIALGFYFVLPDVSAQSIYADGSWGSYMDQVGQPLTAGDSIIDIGSVQYMGTNTINSSSPYTMLPKRDVYSTSTAGIVHNYYRYYYLSQINVFANATFNSGSYYTINYEFNNGSYMSVNLNNLRGITNLKGLYNGDYTQDMENVSINVTYDDTTMVGKISITFKATINTNSIRTIFGNYNNRYNSNLFLNSSDTYSQGFRVYLISAEETQDLSSALLAQITGQNQTIINQNQTIIDNSNITNENLNDIKTDLTDTNSDSSGFQDFISNFEFKDNGGISSIVTLPIELIRSILSDDTCHDLSINLLDTDVSFPNGCSFWSRVPSDRVILYRMLICGLFSYICLTNLFHDIHYLKDPHNLGVDTLDL